MTVKMKEINALIIFHRVDFDGVFSCCTAEKWLDENPDCISYQVYGYTYGDSLPDIENYISQGINTIIILDVTLPVEMMKELKNDERLNIIWIDHHVTSIEGSRIEGYSDIKGKREVERAACEYTWEYFFPNRPCPEIIEYISAYDIWNKKRFDWDNIVFPLQYSLRTEYGVSEEIIGENFGKLINLDENEIEEFLNIGRSILKYLQRTWKSASKNYSFPVTVDNKWNGVAIMTTDFGSNVFNSIKDKYEIYIVVNRKGPDCFNCSFYIDPDTNIDFSAGEYLKNNYGGGGHDKAAGCTLNFEQFERLVKDGEI